MSKIRNTEINDQLFFFIYTCYFATAIQSTSAILVHGHFHILWTYQAAFWLLNDFCSDCVALTCHVQRNAWIYTLWYFMKTMSTISKEGLHLLIMLMYNLITINRSYKFSNVNLYFYLCELFTIYKQYINNNSNIHF